MLVVFIAIIAAPILLITLVAFAAGDWRQVGETPSGDKVFVSSIRALKNNQRTALVRVEYKQPVHPEGGPFVEMRARVRFNCANGATIPTTEWFYSRDRSGRFVVSKKATRDDEFGKALQGGFGEMVSKSVCGTK